MTSGDGPARDGPGDESPEPAVLGVPFRRFVLYFLHLGTTGFGGPIATVGYMQRDLVEKRHWIGRKDFLDGVALGQTMPGPLAGQVAMWVGYLNRGPWGALAVAAAFIGPAFIIVVAVGALYVRFSGLPLVQSLFYGIAPRSWRSSPSPATNSSDSPTDVICGSGGSAPRCSPGPC